MNDKSIFFRIHEKDCPGGKLQNCPDGFEGCCVAHYGICNCNGPLTDKIIRHDYGARQPATFLNVIRFE